MKRVIAIASLCLLLAACASGPVRRVSEPAASIQQLTVNTDGSWSVDLRLQNYSSVPMRFDSIHLDLNVGGETAGTLQGQPAVSIGPESADAITLTLKPTSTARIAIADALASRRGVTYLLKGKVEAAAEERKSRSYDIDRTSTLSPVPGLAGVLR